MHRIHPSLQALAVPIESLKPDPKNARLHDERNVLAVAKSYDTHGQRKPIVVQRREVTREIQVPMDGFNPTGLKTVKEFELIVRAGNGQVEAAKTLGWSHIAAVVVDEGDRDAIAFAIRDNRTAELAEWDWKVIAEEVANFDTTDGAKFEDLGFNTAELLPLRQSDWFLSATGQLEDHTRKPKDDDASSKDKQEVTITGKDAVSFIEAMTLMRDRFGEPGMNPGHVIGRLARHYLATINHSQSPTN